MIDKRDVLSYVLIAGILIVLVSILMVLRGGMTGYAVFEGISEDSEKTLPLVVNITSDFLGEHYSFADLDNDLILYMRMDDLNSSGHPLDLSSYGNNGTLVNSPIINSSNGYWGNGTLFNEANYIEIPDSDSLDSPGTTNEITICSWFKANTHGTTYTGIVGKYDTIKAGSHRMFLMARNAGDNKYGLFLSSSGTSFNANVLTNSALNTNQWYHLCGTSNGTLKLYLDGVQQSATASLAGGIYSSADTSTLIGKFNRADSEFDGLIDEVMIFKRALTYDEIKSIYNSSANPYYQEFSNLSLGSHTLKGYDINKSGELNTTGLITFNIVNETESSSEGSLSVDFDASTSSGTYNRTSIYVDLNTNGSTHYSFLDFNNDLVFWMRMDDVDGISDVLDSSSYENTGSLIGTAKINSSSGFFGNGLWLDGNSDYINMPDSDSLDSPGITNKLTVCAWFNARDHQSSSYRGIVGKYNSGGRAYLLAGNTGDNRYGLFLSETGGALDATVLTNSALNINQWYHLCGIFNGSVANVYLDGVKQSASANLGGINAGASSPLQIGTFWTDNRYFAGNIDEVMIFKRDLSEIEIKSLFNSTVNQYIHNFTGLSNGDYSFRGYAVNQSAYKLNTALRSVTLSSNSSSSENLTLTLDSATIFENVFEIPYIITTNINADSCSFSKDGSANISMHKTNNTYFWYDDVLTTGTYSLDFYCSNGSEIADLSEEYILRKSKVVEDVFYTNSQGLDIHFDFYFNSTNENGRIVMIPDSWSSTKDSYRTSVGGHFLNLGFVAVTLNTRGKGNSEGDRDAFGYECLDIYEAIEYLRTDSAYSDYVNDSIFYIWGFSAAGGKAGVCPAKYPDLFASSFATGGVLNITKWYTTNPSYQVSIEERVGASPTEDSEAFLTRDGAYLGENSQTPIRVTQYTGDSAVNYLLARNYNQSMVGYGKTIDYIEVAGGSHTILGLDESDEFFETYSSELFIPSLGNLKIGGYLRTKNFSIELDNVSRLGLVEYNISGISKTFNITTFEFNGDANLSIFDLSASTDYTISIAGNESIISSDSNGDLIINLVLTNNAILNIIIIPLGDYCGDDSCNNGEICSTCSEDCGTCSTPVTPPATGGSSGGGGGSGFLPVGNEPKIVVSEINNIIANEGDKKTLSLNVKNDGRVFLNNCKLIFSGEIDSWIYSNQLEGIAPGQNVDFIFDVNVPEGIDKKDYSGNLEIKCDEVSDSKNLIVTLPKSLSMIEVKEVIYNKGTIDINYSFDNSNIIGNEVSVEIWLVNEEGIEVQRIVDSFSINRDSGIIERSIVMELEEDLAGIYSIYLAMSSNLGEFVRQGVVLGDSGGTGFTILDQPGNKLIGYAVFLLMIAIGIFFILKGHGTYFKRGKAKKNKWLVRKKARA
ncbi:LamG domain-containing protein [archaeon]|nr:LamG domain-containing protein [archaeon]MBT4241778.1 LamG domain-containing protein [archaeon]MBT4418326.1 LamG domain-containing protein [archaeon]